MDKETKVSDMDIYKTEEYIGSIIVLYKEFKEGYPFKKYIIDKLKNLLNLIEYNNNQQAVRNQIHNISRNEYIDTEELLNIL